MEGITIAIAAILVLAYAGVSARLERGFVTAPMAFLIIGFALGPDGLGVFHGEIGQDSLHLLAELTLVLVLFTDAARIDVKRLRREFTIPLRMLLFGMPGIIALGMVLAMWLLPELRFIEAALLAALLAPTDAALGQAVILNQAVPIRIRQSLNVESGLNDGLALPFVMLFASLAEMSSNIDFGEQLGSAALEVTLGPMVGVVIGIGGGRALEWHSHNRWMSAEFGKFAGLALAFLAYGGAEWLGGNGFLAAFVAGLCTGSVTKSVSDGVYEFMETQGHMLVLVAFVVFGSIMIPAAIPHLDVRVMIYAFCSLTVIRMVPISLSLLGIGLALPTHAYLGWFGPRGLASILFSLIVVERMEIPARQEILAVVVATVTLSVFAHGCSAQVASRAYGRWAKTHVATRKAEHVPAPQLRARRERVTNP